MFADYMVLQRDKPVRVWGSAAPKETVEVSFASQKLAVVVADKTGRWMVELPAMQAKNPAVNSWLNRGSGPRRSRTSLWVKSG